MASQWRLILRMNAHFIWTFVAASQMKMQASRSRCLTRANTSNISRSRDPRDHVTWRPSCDYMILRFPHLASKACVSCMILRHLLRFRFSRPRVKCSQVHALSGCVFARHTVCWHCNLLAVKRMFLRFISRFLSPLITILYPGKRKTINSILALIIRRIVTNVTPKHQMQRAINIQLYSPNIMVAQKNQINVNNTAE